MHRICSSLAQNGYLIHLVGRKIPHHPLPENTPYKTHLIKCYFNKKVFFYAEYNIRLFLFLLPIKMDAICAIDVDTILPCLWYSKLKGVKRVYDAHEYFSEQKEIVTRKNIHRIWQSIERYCIPQYQHGYTVNEFIAAAFFKNFGVNYQVIKNLPIRAEFLPVNTLNDTKIILYQGAVNHGRCFETLIPAMQQVEAELWIVGTGNFLHEVKSLIEINNLSHKIKLLGPTLPEQLKNITPTAYFGLTLFEATGFNQINSLANRFFDYIMAGIPQICVNFPAYAAVQEKYKVAYLINSTDENSLAKAMNKLLNDTVLYKQLQQNCYAAREILNWQNESFKLLSFWRNICIS
ncbi:glycosyltransferase [Hydrotalea sp.]|uniref:glycosyltransferase n=1 Tax=Hydrotalea sp. TaxID=2881279 RepID=UPI003D0BC90B